MNQIRILTALCAGILLWIAACTTDHNQNNFLSEALHVVDDNPKEALGLLESISPELYDSDKDQYMQFVVTMTQARYMDYQDITGDSLILDAQRYFAQSRNYEMAARASYYAAIYWYEGETNDKAVEYWQAAFRFAEQAGNGLFMAKSAYWLGRSYFIQEQWEDAMPYCQKALALYDNQPDPGHYKLYIINMLGLIYQKLQDPEQAYRYFDNGLKMAKNLNDTKYESRFLKNIGTIHRDKGEYQQAKEYFDQALSKQPEPDDMTRIYLSYAKLYRAMNLPDSTRYYLNTIESQIPEITYTNTRRDIYAELATYYKSNERSADKTAHYLQLAHTEDMQIHKIQSNQKIEAINQELEQLKQKKQTESKTYHRVFEFGLIALLILASLLVIAWYNKRRLKEKYAQIKEKYIQTEKEYAHIQEEHAQIQEKYLQAEKKYAQTKEECAQVKEEYTQIKEQYFQTEKDYTHIQEKYIKTNAEYIQAKKEYLQIKEQYLQAEKEYAQTKEEFIQTKEECTQAKEEYLQAKEEFIQSKEEYTQAIDEYTQIQEEYEQIKKEYIQTKEEYEQTKNKYIQTDTEYTTLKLDYDQAKKKHEEMERKYYQASNQRFELKLNQMYLSVDGLKSIAKSIEDLYQKKLAYTGSQVWEQLLMLREKFSDQFAGYAKLKLAKLHNGETALPNLTPGYLAIIQLTSMKCPEEEVARMLGYRSDAEESLQFHKQQIRRILTRAGMKDKDIRDLLPEEK